MLACSSLDIFARISFALIITCQRICNSVSERERNKRIAKCYVNKNWYGARQQAEQAEHHEVWTSAGRHHGLVLESTTDWRLAAPWRSVQPCAGRHHGLALTDKTYDAGLVKRYGAADNKKHKPDAHTLIKNFDMTHFSTFD